MVVKQRPRAEVEDGSSTSGTCTPCRSARSPGDGLMRVKAHGVTVAADIPNRRPDRRGAGLRPADARAGVARRGRRRSTSTTLRAAGDASSDVASRCWRRRRSRASAGSTGSTTTWCAPIRSRCLASTLWRRPRQGHRPRAGDVGGRQRPIRLPRSARAARSWPSPRRARNVACAGGAADRRHEQPELRQSREAGDHVAVRRGGRRHRRGLPRAGHPDHGRQRQPLQRDRRQGDPADAGAWRRRADGATPIAIVHAHVQGRRGDRAARRRREASWAAPSICSAMHGLLRGEPPALDLDAGAAAAAAARRAGGRRSRAMSAHDCAEGGLAVHRRGVLLRHRRHGRRHRHARGGRRARCCDRWTRRSSASRPRASWSRRRRRGSSRCWLARPSAGVPAAHDRPHRRTRTVS